MVCIVIFGKQFLFHAVHLAVIELFWSVVCAVEDQTRSEKKETCHLDVRWLPD